MAVIEKEIEKMKTVQLIFVPSCGKLGYIRLFEVKPCP